MLEIILTVLQILGVTSLVGLIGLLLAFLNFQPEIVIEGAVDQSRPFNSESKLRIKNNGRIAARNVRADVYNLSVKFGSILIQDCIFINCGPALASRLSNGETTEIIIRPGLGLDQGQHFYEYSYTLAIMYQAKLLFFKKSFEKKWNIELNNYPDGYSWAVTIA